MPKVAVICAFNSAVNTGMVTVDLAAVRFFSQSIPSAEIVLFNVDQRRKIAGPSGHLTYEHLSEVSQLKDFDVIVIWGDFLLSRRYHKADLANRVRKRVPDVSGSEIDEIVDKHARLLLLADADDDILRRTVCFGGSLYVNTPLDDAEKTYRRRLDRLLSLAKLVKVRDPISVAFVNNYVVREQNVAGIDAAFLLSRGDPVDTSTEETKRIGYSFGRRLSQDPAALARMQKFVGGIAERLDLQHQLDVSWLSASRDDPIGAVLTKIEDIRSCDLIITDTYHCAINALREGVPTLCIGRGAEALGGTLGEKKKELLFSMFNARDFYVFVEWLGGEAAVKQAVEKYCEVFADRSRFEAVQQNIRCAIAHSSYALRQAVA